MFFVCLTANELLPILTFASLVWMTNLKSVGTKHFQHLETVIKSRIPGLQSLINKTIAELEAELSRLGKPIATDTGVSILFIF